LEALEGGVSALALSRPVHGLRGPVCHVAWVIAPHSQQSACRVVSLVIAASVL
jgi:hypothetical protein